MATEKKTPKTAPDADGQSTRPANWPGIPGRSAENESPARKADSEVTESQRELEQQSDMPRK